MDSNNPINTLRNAIKSTAEDLASKEFIDKPESKHYEAALNLYREVKDIDPEVFQKLVKLASKNKKLKDSLGTKLYSVFHQVGDKILLSFNDKIIAIKQKDLTNEELNQEIENLFKEINSQITKDSRIITYFSGKEYLLKQAIDLSIEAGFELLEI